MGWTGEVSVWIGRVWVGGEVSVWTVNRFRKTHRESVFGSVIGVAGPVIDWVCGVWHGDRLAELGVTGVR